ncbi:MAG: hypothetical protein JWP84_4195 [Tardiphaga sp.]|jgi:hypothetical protein|nr:hypothetical protein [Tardiphaga sp.]
MQILASRKYAVLNYDTLAEYTGRDTLLRRLDGTFLLHMSSEGAPDSEDRLLCLEARDAILWLNQSPEEFGSFWETS